MILTGHEDLRIVKTIEGIKTAFEKLICENDYEKITCSGTYHFVDEKEKR